MRIPMQRLWAALLTTAAASATCAEDAMDLKVRNGWAIAAQQARAIASRPSRSFYPRHTTSDSAQAWLYEESWEWTSGFFPAQLWLLHQQFAGQGWDREAAAWQDALEAQSTNTSTHDLGFMVGLPFSHAYRLTGKVGYRDVALKAALSAGQRYNPKVGAFRSWGVIDDPASFEVVIEHMGNLELPFWAARHGGDASLNGYARQHAQKTREHLVRPDGSTFHLAEYNPATGALKTRGTVRGYSDTSTWTRGQAWALHGFTTAYRYTRDDTLLDTARRVAHRYVSRLPPDIVPAWDFDDPAGTRAPKDSSSAAIAASGLLELSWLDPEPARAGVWRAAGLKLLEALLSPPYLATRASAGSPSNSQAILLHSTLNHHGNAPYFNHGSAWGDYYLVEALLRYRRLAPAWPALRPLIASASSEDGGRLAAFAVDGRPSSRWNASGGGQWLSVELTGARTVRKIGLAFYKGDERATRFEIATSVDGETWTTHFRGVSSGQTLEKEYYDIPDTTARHVRITGLGNTQNRSIDITELSVH
ncbi:discoidin domain-containing protein [Aquabacterium sp. A7-Y]|uniref:discoidin domain-containing protein n=1 Tax=Aquabacterium sp. A7-Y TaxID=1349605 RepID=UPI00223C8EF0|nr:discoidin domain-containing protein [Aquabacterium sp. A7-Y]MCW7538082.1 discoidin domain-containing protein [Aquabacterium sp. A7-Y]